MQKTIQQAATFDTPAESLIIGPFTLHLFLINNMNMAQRNSFVDDVKLMISSMLLMSILETLPFSMHIIEYLRSKGKNKFIMDMKPIMKISQISRSLFRSHQFPKHSVLIDIMPIQIFMFPM